MARRPPASGGGGDRARRLGHNHRPAHRGPAGHGRLFPGSGGARGDPGGNGYARWTGTSRRRLVVCDTTHPATVAALDLSDAFVVVSSKSGTTLEPNALLAHAWAQLPDPSRYAAITDPGTPLAALAAERGFARCFENAPDIGGRYSVLSYFGMVPAALVGYDVAELCERALAADLHGRRSLAWPWATRREPGGTRSPSWFPSRSP